MEDLEYSFKQFSTKSISPDGLSLKVLKLCLPAVSRAFLAIFNKSIILNKFPKACKHSNILLTSPNLKVPNPSSLGDYACVSFRLLSKLLNISKV